MNSWAILKSASDNGKIKDIISLNMKGYSEAKNGNLGLIASI
jgi:hypothetical protein